MIILALGSLMIHLQKKRRQELKFCCGRQDEMLILLRFNDLTYSLPKDKSRCLYST